MKLAAGRAPVPLLGARLRAWVSAALVVVCSDATCDHPYESREIQLPSSGRDVWTNPRGSHVFSNESELDPNVGSTQEWRRLEATR